MAHCDVSRRCRGAQLLGLERGPEVLPIARTRPRPGPRPTTPAMCRAAGEMERSCRAPGPGGGETSATDSGGPGINRPPRGIALSGALSAGHPAIWPRWAPRRGLRRFKARGAATVQVSTHPAVSARIAIDGARSALWWRSARAAAGEHVPAWPEAEDLLWGGRRRRRAAARILASFAATMARCEVSKSCRTHRPSTFRQFAKGFRNGVRSGKFPVNRLNRGLAPLPNDGYGDLGGTNPFRDRNLADGTARVPKRAL